jgi:outer membrane receptor protein involved in Fe transport
VRQKLGEPVGLDFAWFVMKGSDLIEVKSGKKRNIGDFEFKGAETMLTAKFSDSLNGQINHTWFVPGSKTTGRPKDKAGASLKYSERRMSAAVSGTYVWRYYSGDNDTGRLKNYFLVDLKSDYKLSGGLSVFAAVDNITDKKYQVYYDAVYTMPGRTITGGINYTF